MYWPTLCWHDFIIKDVTVKQLTLNVTDMEKINIVSSQAVRHLCSKTKKHFFKILASQELDRLKT